MNIPVVCTICKKTRLLQPIHAKKLKSKNCKPCLISRAWIIVTCRVCGRRKKISWQRTPKSPDCIRCRSISVRCRICGKSRRISRKHLPRNPDHKKCKEQMVQVRRLCRVCGRDRTIKQSMMTKNPDCKSCRPSVHWPITCSICKKTRLVPPQAAKNRKSDDCRPCQLKRMKSKRVMAKCEVCGRERRSLRPSQAIRLNSLKRCRSCREEALSTHIECPTCGRKKRMSHSRLKDVGSSYCFACYTGKMKKILVVCRICGKEKRVNPSAARSRKSPDCYDCLFPNAKDSKVEKECRHCGVRFKTYTGDRVRRDRDFCSRDCYHGHQKGRPRINTGKVKPWTYSTIGNFSTDLKSCLLINETPRDGYLRISDQLFVRGSEIKGLNDRLKDLQREIAWFKRRTKCRRGSGSTASKGKAVVISHLKKGARI